MPFKTTEHANLGYVDKDVKEKLDILVALDKRTIKGYLETLILNAWSDANIKQKVVD